MVAASEFASSAFAGSVCAASGGLPGCRTAGTHPHGLPWCTAGKPPVLSVNPHVPALLAYAQQAAQQVSGASAC